MHPDPQYLQTLSKSEVISLANRCGQETTQLEIFLEKRVNRHSIIDLSFNVANILLRTLIIGLDKEILPIAHVPQITNQIFEAISSENLSLTFWNDLSKKQQDDFHALQKEALEKINKHNDGSVSATELKKIEDTTAYNLRYFKLRYIDLSSEEILGLFTLANRPAQERNSVHSLLILKDNPEEAIISPRELGIAAHTLLFRADRRLNSHRHDSISCHQALQLIELALNAFAFLGKESNLKNVDFGNPETALAIKTWAIKQGILDPIESVGKKLTTTQDKSDFASLRSFYQKIFSAL